MATSDDIIVVTATQPESGGSSGWMANVSYYAGGAASGGGGSGGVSVFGVENVAKLVADLKDGSKIIVKVPGQPNIVIDGKADGGFFARSLTVALKVATSLADGNGQTIISNLDSQTQAFAQDLVEDISLMTSDVGRAIRMTNVDDLQAEAPSGVNLPTNTQAFTITEWKVDFDDIDLSSETAGYWQIFIDSDKFRSRNVGNSLYAGRRGRYESLEITMLHELFHIPEGETVYQEFQKFGTTNSLHDSVFDKAAAKLLVAVVKPKNLSDLLGEFEFYTSPGVVETYNGTSGGDSIDASGGFGSRIIEGGAGNDIIDMAFSDSYVAPGAGDDLVRISGGRGRLVLYDDGGSDTLHFTSGSLSSLSVETVTGWAYVGVRGDGEANLSATELSSAVIFRQLCT